MKIRVQMKPKSFTVIAMATIVMCLVSGCTKKSVAPSSANPATGPGPNEVWITNYAYNPSSITISVNTTVTWTNKDQVDHTVTSNSGLFNSGQISTGGTFSYKFTTTGSYPYTCSDHTYMTGTVVVH